MCRFVMASTELLMFEVNVINMTEGRRGPAWVWGSDENSLHSYRGSPPPVYTVGYFN